MNVPRKPRSVHLDALRAGTATLRTVHRAEGAERLRLTEVLEALPGVGPVTVASVGLKAGVAPWLELRDMSDEQLERVLAALPVGLRS